MHAGRASQLTGRDRLARLHAAARTSAAAMEHERHRFEAMKGAAPVVVAAPLLFPTPPAMANRVASIAMQGARPNGRLRLLEPSAGTGNLLAALQHVDRLDVVAVEIEPTLAEHLERFEGAEIHCRDFLGCGPELGRFDLIVMNPPFKRGLDITHIEHARGMLRDSGRLVALCYNGPKQQARLKPAASEWHVLPAGSFRESGTNVDAAIVVFEN